MTEPKFNYFVGKVPVNREQFRAAIRYAEKHGQQAINEAYLATLRKDDNKAS